MPPLLRVCVLPEVTTMWLTDPNMLHGVRLEMVDSSMRPGLEDTLKAARAAG